MADSFSQAITFKTSDHTDPRGRTPPHCISPLSAVQFSCHPLEINNNFRG